MMAQVSSLRAKHRVFLAVVISWCVASSNGLRLDDSPRAPQSSPKKHKAHDRKHHEEQKSFGGYKTVVSKARKQSWKSEEPGYRHHYQDDWASGFARMYHNSSDPPCVRKAYSTTGGNCKFLTSTVCGGGGSQPVSELQGKHRVCLAPKVTCAVVGSSQHLLSVKWGRKIDKHEWVIRMNAAPAGSKSTSSDRHQWADHVGTRTDVRFVNTYGSMPQPREAPQEPLCIFLHEPKIGCGRFCWRNPGLCNITCGSGLKDIEPMCAQTCNVSRLSCKGARMRHEQTWHKNDIVFMDHFHGGIVDQVLPHATAGFKAVVYAMLTCKHVKVYGFGPGCDGSVGARYYENEKEVFTWHHYDEELRIMKAAATERKKKEGVRQIMPPELQSLVRAKSLELMLPECVGKHPEMKRLVNRFMYTLTGSESPGESEGDELDDFPEDS